MFAIFVCYSAESYYQSAFKDDFLVSVDYSGIVKWNFGGTFSTACNLKIEKFPFDTQNCFILVGVWSYTASELDTVPFPVYLKFFKENPIWKLQATDSAYVSYQEVGDCLDCSYAVSKFTFTWVRKSKFYVLTILLPTALLTLVALSAFWLPSTCGEKVSLQITIFLSMSVLQIVITEHMPITSDVTPRISKFQMTHLYTSSCNLLSI